MNIGNISKILA